MGVGKNDFVFIIIDFVNLNLKKMVKTRSIMLKSP